MEPKNDTTGTSAQADIVGDTTVRSRGVSKENSSKVARTNTSFHHFRYVIIILGGMACGNMFFTRLSITVAMMSMVNHTHLHLVEHPNSTIEDYFGPDYIETGEFRWSNEIQQTIISGYMIAYTFPQVITTKLSMKYGFRKAVTVGLGLCSLSCLLVPIMSYWGWQWLMLLRFVNGAGASSLLPSMIGAIGDWMPYEDSALGLSLLQFVQTLLYVATPLLSGLLTAIQWKWAFYVPGITGLSFALIWWLAARDDPDSCPFVSQKEIDLIKGTTKNSEMKNGTTESANVKRAATKPERRKDVNWYFMFKIKSFYGLVLIWLLYCASSGGLLFLMPSYFHRVLKIPVEDNGFYNFIAQVGVMFSMLWPGPVIAFLQGRFNTSLTCSRRIVVFIFTFMGTLTLGYVAAFHQNQLIAFSLHRFFIMTTDTISTATLMSQYGKDGLSGLVFSVVNTIGNLGSVIFCWAAGRFLDYTGESIECWSWIFTAMNIMNITIFLLYAIFMKSEPIPIKSSSSPSSEKNDKDVKA